jgi:hypothetical protein
MAYDNIDGVGELAMGCGMLGFGVLGWMQAHTPKEAIWHQMYAFLLYVGVMLAIIHYGSKAIKERITYPRTGFVEYRKRARWLPGIAGVVIGSLTPVALFAALRRHWDLTEAVSFAGLFIAACIARGAALWAVRWKWIVVCLMAAGSVAIPALPADLLTDAADHSRFFALDKAAGAFYLLILYCGALLSISGGISLRLYLRHTQAPSVGAE